MSEVFDFSQTESAKAAEKVMPGVYMAKITKAELKKPEGKTPFLELEVQTADGSKFSDQIYVTIKTLGRLQYIHEFYVGIKLDRVMSSVDEIGSYFSKLFETESVKKISRKMIIGGQKSNKGGVFPKLPYTSFIVDPNEDMPEGVFEEDSKEWNQYVKEPNTAAAVKGNDNPIVGTGNIIDDLPF